MSNPAHVQETSRMRRLRMDREMNIIRSELEHWLENTIKPTHEQIMSELNNLGLSWPNPIQTREQYNKIKFLKGTFEALVSSFRSSIPHWEELVDADPSLLQFDDSIVDYLISIENDMLPYTSDLKRFRTQEQHIQQQNQQVVQEIYRQPRQIPSRRRKTRKTRKTRKN